MHPSSKTIVRAALHYANLRQNGVQVSACEITSMGDGEDTIYTILLVDRQGRTFGRTRVTYRRVRDHERSLKQVKSIGRGSCLGSGPLTSI